MKGKRCKWCRHIHTPKGEKCFEWYAIKEPDYRRKQWFSLTGLANFIAEYNGDAKGDGWLFWQWLDKKCRK